MSLLSVAHDDFVYNYTQQRKFVPVLYSPAPLGWAADHPLPEDSVVPPMEDWPEHEDRGAVADFTRAHSRLSILYPLMLHCVSKVTRNANADYSVEALGRRAVASPHTAGAGRVVFWRQNPPRQEDSEMNTVDSGSEPEDRGSVGALTCGRCMLRMMFWCGCYRWQ